MLVLYVLLSVLVTSFISGFLGMGGGSLLMGAYLIFFPVEAAMVLHGVTQFAANGSRSFFLKDNIQWKVLPSYFLGIIPALLFFYSINYIPTKAVVYLLLGSFPFISLVLRRFDLLHLSIKRMWDAFACGALVTIVQLMAGASGVVLTEFYLHTDLSRKEIVSTESFTQSIAHFIKCLYFLFIVEAWDAIEMIPWYLYIGAIVVSVIGTYLGKQILIKMSDKHFKRIAIIIIRTVAIALFLKGLNELGVI